MRKLIFIIILFFSPSVLAFDLFGLFSNETELFCECETINAKTLSDSGSKEKKSKCSNSFDLIINEKKQTIETNYLYRHSFKKSSYKYEERNGNYSFIEGKEIATEEGVKTFAISRTTGDLKISNYSLMRFEDNIRIMLFRDTEYNCDLKKNKKNKF